MTKIVLCQFPSSSTHYAYYTDIEDLKIDDFVIVASPYGSGSNNRINANDRFHSEALKGYPTVVRIASIEETVESVHKAAKWIIQKIDIDAYVARLTAEQQLDVLNAKIKKATQAALEQLQLARLRGLSPELDTLLVDYENLTGITIEDKPIEVRKHKRALASGIIRRETRPRSTKSRAGTKRATKAK